MILSLSLVSDSQLLIRRETMDSAASLEEVHSTEAETKLDIEQATTDAASPPSVASLSHYEYTNPTDTELEIKALSAPTTPLVDVFTVITPTHTTPYTLMVVPTCQTTPPIENNLCICDPPETKTMVRFVYTTLDIRLWMLPDHSAPAVKSSDTLSDVDIVNRDFGTSQALHSQADTSDTTITTFPSTITQSQSQQSSHLQVQERKRIQTYAPTLRASHSPRPSPPTFLYPEPIVPKMNEGGNSTSWNSSTGLIAKLDYEYTYLPLVLKFVVFGFMALGTIWAIIVYWVNFPPPFLQRQDTRRANRKRMKKNRGDDGTGFLPEWVLRCLGRKGGYEQLKMKKNKPDDKPSKYAPLPDLDSGLSTATALLVGHANKNQSIELKSRKQQQCPSPPPKPEHLRYASSLSPQSVWGTRDEKILMEQSAHLPREDRDRDGVGTRGHTRVAGTPSLPMSMSPLSANGDSPCSPRNPYIPPIPTLRTRSSAEWLAEREVFLSNPRNNPTDAPTLLHHHHHYTPSPTPSYSSYSHSEDLDALEAQVPSNRSSVFSLRSYLNNGSTQNLDNRSGNANGNRSEKRDGRSWLDAVDGAVTKAVGKVARWTDDDDGNEELLLPVAKGKTE